MLTIIAPIPEKFALPIQIYRQKYDPLVTALPPHITVLKPFRFPEPLETLHAHLTEVGEIHAPIKSSVLGWDIQDQRPYKLCLPLIAGHQEFVELRKDILTGPLKSLSEVEPDYRPRIMLGQFAELEQVESAKVDLANFEPQFIFRVTHLELLQWEQPGSPWIKSKRIGLEGTLAGAKRKSVSVKN